MPYSATKFEVATSNSLGKNTFTRNVTDGQQTDFGTKLIPFFSKEKSGYKKIHQELHHKTDSTKKELEDLRS